MNKITLKIQHYGFEELLRELNKHIYKEFYNGKEYSFNSLKELDNFVQTFHIFETRSSLMRACIIDTAYVIDHNEDNTIIFSITIYYNQDAINEDSYYRPS